MILEAIAAAPSTAPQVTAVHQEPTEAQLMSSADVFRRDGDYWTVTFEGQTVRVRDLKGMRYLARLLADPGREFHVLDLVAAEGGRPVQLAGDQGGSPSRSARRRG